MDEDRKWAIRILEAAQNELLEDMRNATFGTVPNPIASQRAWEGLNMVHRTILALTIPVTVGLVRVTASGRLRVVA